MKKIVRLTESDLHKIIKKSVEKIIRESGHEGWREEDWNPYHPDYKDGTDEYDEPEDFDEKYYEDK